MDEVRIPNRATYSPVALADIVVAAPLVSRVLLGATLPGRVLAAAAAGAYVASALTDWRCRRNVRRVDFRTVFGVELFNPPPLPREARVREVDRLARLLNDHYVPIRSSRQALARAVNRRLTDYLAGLTGQRVETSDRVRDFMLVQAVFPFAVGGCDMLSGDIAILGDAGVFEPHVLAHELCHRKGYLKELEAQVLAYLALSGSGEAVLVQSARCERLYRQMTVLAGGDPERCQEIVDASSLRPELRAAFRVRQPRPGAIGRAVGAMARRVYDARMRLAGQKGLSDYDEGFTNYLSTVEASGRTPGDLT